MIFNMLTRFLISCLTLFVFLATAKAVERAESDEPYIAVLGVAQDAGFPQAGCQKKCCKAAWQDGQLRRYASCLAVVDPRHRQRWMMDCTPDFPQQLHALDQLLPTKKSPGLNGIFLTHAHIGHYTGLIHLGREVIGAKGVSVYAMPRMRHFLESNGPWEQLITLGQINVRKIAAGQEVSLNDRISVVPFLVPHRDEYSETVGFQIRGPSRSVIYLPDIDKWERWEVAIEDILKDADIAYLDGTFFTTTELPGRNMSEIPHPFVIESIARFKKLPAAERKKIRFIHANHTNPILDSSSSAWSVVKAAGHHVAEQGERFGL